MAEAKTDTLAAKPTRPDEDAFRQELEKRKKVEQNTLRTMREAQGKLKEANPNNERTGGDPRLASIHEQLSQLRKKQADSKASRGSLQDKIKTLDTAMRNKMTEIKSIRDKIPFRSTVAIDDEITRLNEKMNIGKLTLVDERKTAKDVSTLRTQRKQFLITEQLDAEVTSYKNDIANLKQSLNSPEHKADNEEYNRLTQEKEQINASASSKRDALQELRKQFADARQAHENAYQEVKSLQDEHWSEKRRYNEYSRAIHKAQDEKRAAERQAFVTGKRRAVLEEQVEEAKFPAWEAEMKACARLLRINGASQDPEQPGDVESHDSAVSSKIAKAEPQKPDGVRIASKKDQEDVFFVGGAVKKNKRKTKSQQSRVNLSFNPAAMQDYELIKVKQPESEGEIPDTVNKIRTQLKWYQDHTAEDTLTNVEKARKELENFDLESKGAKPSSTRDNAPVSNAKAPTLADDSTGLSKGVDEQLPPKDVTIEGEA